MNRGQIKTAILRYGFVQQASLVDGWIDAAYFRVINAAKWPFRQESATFTIPANSNEVALPADFLSMFNVTTTVSGNKFANQLGWMEFQDLTMYLASSGPGTPRHYAIFKNRRLFVAPTPTENVETTVYYDKSIGGLTSDGSEPVFPEQYHRIIVEGALAIGYGAFDQKDEQTAHREEFDRLLEQMITDLTTVADDLAGTIGSGRDLRYFCQELRGHGFKVSDAVATGLLNSALFEVWGEFRYRFRERPPIIVAADATTPNRILDFPAEYSRPVALYDITGGRHEKMEAIPPDFRRDLLDHQHSHGRPQVWTHTTGEDSNPIIEMWPPAQPGDQFELVYVARPLPMEAPTDVPGLPYEHRDVILYGALVKAALRAPAPDGNHELQASTRAQVRLFREEYKARLDAMRADLLIDQHARPRMVWPGADYGVDGDW